MDPIRWGIIATGKIARKLANDIQLVDNAELIAVASRDFNKAKSFAEEYSIPKAYGNYEDLAKDPEIDVVYIATPHTGHFENTIICLENKKHVLCEKPIGMNAKQLFKMIEVAKSNKRFLMEAFWTQFIPAYQKCKEIISSGEIGEIKFIQADFAFKAPCDFNGRLYNKKLGGGSLLDIGIYPVFIALDLLGKPDQILSSANIGDTGIDETCNIIFNYTEKKASANLYSSILNNTPTEALISGTKGEIKLHSQWHFVKKISVFKSREPVNEMEIPVTGHGYTHEIEEVNKCISNQLTESKLLPLKQTVLLHQTLDTIRKQINLNYIYD